MLFLTEILRLRSDLGLTNEDHTLNHRILGEREHLDDLFAAARKLQVRPYGAVAAFDSGKLQVSGSDRAVAFADVQLRRGVWNRVHQHTETHAVELLLHCARVDHLLHIRILGHEQEVRGAVVDTSGRQQRYLLEKVYVGGCDGLAGELSAGATFLKDR